jgi:tetratricopeptide (TPR) repeat protein
VQVISIPRQNVIAKLEVVKDLYKFYLKFNSLYKAADSIVKKWVNRNEAFAYYEEIWNFVEKNKEKFDLQPLFEEEENIKSIVWHYRNMKSIVQTSEFVIDYYELAIRAMEDLLLFRKNTTLVSSFWETLVHIEILEQNKEVITFKINEAIELDPDKEQEEIMPGNTQNIKEIEEDITVEKKSLLYLNKILELRNKKIGVLCGMLKYYDEQSFNKKCYQKSKEIIKQIMCDEMEVLEMFFETGRLFQKMWSKKNKEYFDQTIERGQSLEALFEQLREPYTPSFMSVNMEKKSYKQTIALEEQVENYELMLDVGRKMEYIHLYRLRKAKNINIAKYETLIETEEKIDGVLQVLLQWYKSLSNAQEYYRCNEELLSTREKKLKLFQDLRGYYKWKQNIHKSNDYHIKENDTWVQISKMFSRLWWFDKMWDSKTVEKHYLILKQIKEKELRVYEEVWDEEKIFIVKRQLSEIIEKLWRFYEEFNNSKQALTLYNNNSITPTVLSKELKLLLKLDSNKNKKAVENVTEVLENSASSIEGDSEKFEVFTSLGESCVYSGSYVKALDYYIAAIKVEESFPERNDNILSRLHYNIALCCRELKFFDNARGHLEQSIVLDERNFEAYESLWTLCSIEKRGMLSQEEKIQSKQYLDRAIEFNPLKKSHYEGLKWHINNNKEFPQALR